MEPAPTGDLKRLVNIGDDPEIPTLLRASTVARMLGMTPDAFRKWRRSGRGPTGVRYGVRWMYVDTDVQDWIKEHRSTTPASDNH